MNNWYFIYGPMFAQKTTKLCSFIKYTKKKYLVLKHTIDNRYAANKIITHDGVFIECTSISSSEDLIKIPGIDKYEVLFIDEIQFFAKDFIDTLKKYNFTIYFAGLHKDYNNVMFPISKILHQIIPKKNKIKLKALCECGSLAVCNKYLGEKTNTNIIPGSNIYKPLCKICYFN